MTIQDIETIMSNLETTFKEMFIQKFYWIMKMVYTVDQHFAHISELEEVIDLIKKYHSVYYEEYRPTYLPLLKIAGEVAENTRANHYEREKKELDVYDVLSSSVLFPKYKVTDVTSKRKK